MTLSDVLSRLEGVKGRDGKYMARCPCHGDSTPSLSVSLGDDNRILLKCFAGCSVEDIVWSMNLTMKDLFADEALEMPPQKKTKTYQPATLEAEYLYAGGVLKKQKFRKADGSKFCTWQHLNGGKWEKGRNNILPGLYQSQPDLPDIFFLVEGEKDVENLKSAGMAAVSLPDGSQSKWESTYDSVFAGKQVVILPDNDEPGSKYARMCAEKLHSVAAGVWVLDLKEVWPEIPEKADISDMMGRFGSQNAVDLVLELLNRSQRWEPEQAAKEDPFLSLFKPLTEFQEEEATWIIPGWIPEGQITVLAGDGGVGKTSTWVSIVAAISSGRTCILDPAGHTREPATVAFCTTEDSIRKKLIKSLRVAGACMKNVIAMDMVGDKTGSLRKFKFGSSEMERFIRYYKPALCIFDPIQGFIDKDLNMGSRNAMRDALAPLIALGEEVGTTFLIVSHTNKRKGASGRDRISDSSDVWDIARSVIMIGNTENQGVRYLSNEKNNYAGLAQTVLFSIDGGVLSYEGTSWKRDRDYIMDLVAAKAPAKKDGCREFILETLENAEGHVMKSDDLQKEAERHGHTFATFRRAREDLRSGDRIEIYSEGSSRKKNRVYYTRLKSLDEPEALPDETPVPFEELPAIV